ncbi:hypothetical protein P106B_08 [Rhizobium phage vB_RglS_P106B]|uniref:Uncharacterized protein n=1 Tax=Rhizobium phage vB_RglS_P106B TaxID=1458697 RepID=W6EKD8_9CAUD|nr:hypothetical protein P106B_08 [Rhizobium phage vB_RglS_P106B]AHJ10691.1 hypothetical protein P106B_08 [Rhizobium phage vB_RglS_P106B]
MDRGALDRMIKTKISFSTGALAFSPNARAANQKALINA